MKTRSYLYIITGAAFWGLIGLFVKQLAGQSFSAMQIVVLRALASAVCITFVIAKCGWHNLKISLRDSWMFIGTGIISLVFFNYCYFNCM